MKHALGLCGHVCATATTIEAALIEWNVEHGRGRQLSTMLDACARARAQSLVVFILSSQEEPVGFRAHETFDRYFVEPALMVRVAEALVECDVTRKASELDAAIARNDDDAAVVLGVELRGLLASVERIPAASDEDAARTIALRHRVEDLLCRAPNRIRGLDRVEAFIDRFGKTGRTQS